MSKFKLEMVPDENGKMVRKWTPIEDLSEATPEIGCVYGNIVRTDADHIEETKSDLLEDMIARIRTLAKHDNFWIVKPTDDGQFVVAWKAEFPQMVYPVASNMAQNKDIPVLTLGAK